MEELPIIQKTYDLIKWYVPILNRLPRDHRFALGDRFINGLYDLLESLSQARYSQEKLHQLTALNIRLDILRHQTRLLFDFSLFSDDRVFLAEARLASEDYLATLRLKIHPIKSQLFATRLGANFVGFRVFPDHIRVRSHNLKRARCRLRRLRQSYRQGLASFEDVTQSAQSWSAHLKHGDTWHLRQHIFNSLTFEAPR